jgi:CHAT domain-containing protein
MKNDSFLQMGELATVKWNAELITLSACNTGLGDLYVGDGMFGLSTVLLAGGAKGTILTRWKAPDATAPDFMKNFYTYILDGKLPVDALHAAQLDFIGSDNAPQHWALFKYVGIPW